MTDGFNHSRGNYTANMSNKVRFYNSSPNVNYYRKNRSHENVYSNRVPAANGKPRTVGSDKSAKIAANLHGYVNPYESVNKNTAVSKNNPYRRQIVNTVPTQKIRRANNGQTAVSRNVNSQLKPRRIPARTVSANKKISHENKLLLGASSAVNAVSNSAAEIYKKTKDVSLSIAKGKHAAPLYDDKMRPLTKDGEIKKARTPIPIATISITIICTLMIMVIVYSSAQVYQYTMDVGALEYEISTLAKKQAELSLELEQKDDIRVIEDYATNVIGMVKGDTVEKRYITLSGGEKIEILDPDIKEDTEISANSNDTGFFSTILSAIGENFNALLEYLK